MNSEMRELYPEVILDHYKRPRNWGALPNATEQAEGYNPLCGDQIKVSLVVNAGLIEGIGVEGAGCAICTASASMMSEAISGKTVDEAIALFSGFLSVVTGTDDGSVELGDLEVLAGVKEHPVRIKCATLAWHTLKAALESRNSASTES